MQFASTLRALNTIHPVRAPVSVAPLPCAVRRSAPCVCVCNLRAGGSLVASRRRPVPRPPRAGRCAYRHPARWLLRAVGADCTRLRRHQTCHLAQSLRDCSRYAPPNYCLVQSAAGGVRRSGVAIAAVSARCAGVLRTCAPTPGALCGGDPPAPPIRIKRIVGTARDAYASCPAIQSNKRETITRGRANLGGIPPAPRYLPI